jgi:hypothetical protein
LDEKLWEKSLMAREFIGTVGVDSGSVMIIDPCYLNDPMRWKTEKFAESAEKADAEGNYPMASNMRRLFTEKTQLQNLISDWDKYCEDSKDRDYQPCEYAGGVISPTRNGDGGFPVYVHRDKDGRVKKMEIIF